MPRCARNYRSWRSVPAICWRPCEALSRYYLGQIALLQRKYSQAIGYFRRVLELQPTADRVHYPLAQALRASGEGPVARRHLACHGERLPSSADPLMAELKALNGDCDQAWSRFRQLDFIPLWISGVDTERLEELISGCGKDAPPSLLWYEGTQLLQPPPVQAEAPMREYPAMVPY